MKALFFGSIGTLIETSELQRQAFNMAFLAHDLDWHWDQYSYREMLRDAGGADRIAIYARQRNQQVDATRIHQTKSRIFQTALTQGTLPLRAGVIDTLSRAKKEGVHLALVTTTSRANVDAVLKAASNTIAIDLFEHIITRANVSAPKPDAECYRQGLTKLGLSRRDVVAIEDNVDGVASAKAAGLHTVAFLGANTHDHTVPGADLILTDALVSDAVWSMHEPA